MKKSADKQKTEITQKLKELKNYLGIKSQAALAQELGLRRSVVSLWERGQVSTEGLLKLANVASPEMGLWFLEEAAKKAGLSLHKLKRIATEKAFTHPGPEPERKALRLEIDEEIKNPLFSPGDLVFLDTRATQSDDLQEFWGQLVLLQFPGKPESESTRKGELAFPTSAEELGEFLYDPGNVESGARALWPSGGKRFGVLRPYLASTFGVLAQFEDLEVLSFSKFGPGIQSQTVGFYGIPKEKRTTAAQSVIKTAPPVRLFKGLQLLGRVVAWEKKPTDRARQTQSACNR